MLESHLKVLLQEKESARKELLVLRDALKFEREKSQKVFLFELTLKIYILFKTSEELLNVSKMYASIRNERDNFKERLDEMKKDTENIENQILGKVEIMRMDFSK